MGLDKLERWQREDLQEVPNLEPSRGERDLDTSINDVMEADKIPRTDMKGTMI